MKDFHTNVWARGQFNIFDNYIWFVPYGHNFLCKYSMEKSAIEEVVTLDVEKHHPQGFDSTFCDGHNVIMIPGFEDKLFVYNIGDRTTRTIDLPMESTKTEKYSLYCIYGDYLYMLPVSYSNVVKIDLRSLMITVIPLVNTNDFYDCDLCNSSLYLVNNTNELFCFDLEKEDLSSLYKGEDGTIYKTIAYCNDELYFTDESGKIYSWSVKNNEALIINQMDVTFRGSYVIKNHLYLLPLHEDSYFIEYNIESNSYKKIVLDNNNAFEKWPHSSFSRGTVSGSKLYFFSTQYSTIIEYDPLLGKKVERRTTITEIPDDVLNTMFHNQYKSGRVLKEGDEIGISIENFLDFYVRNNCVNNS